ncbi:glycosyltransferase family 2 protein [Oxalobacteraceae bacterium R-40]|uniref:Glycosyltransferase family 2 protein n=1 Tax=Keguizhuia sedimenti TaxID=3064264 RepID=A0ABU1BSG7_9BURK|nr:glycosyltransferase family 2 protein [Oxalobacteraceae bacterium R-40]
MLWLSLIIFLLVSALCLEVAIGARRIAQLKKVCAQSASGRIKVSVIIPACNEAGTLESALDSVLKVSYPDLEVIVVNDRSTDGTASILEHMTNRHPALRVVQIAALPPGWLGKNHALHQGVQLASGDYILFTDADVTFAPGSIGMAVAYCEAHQVDHLTLLFDILARTPLLAMLVLSFSVNFMARFKPWKVAKSKRYYLGAGGFNLVRRSAYFEAGTHAAIPMAVLDDLMLGRLIKQHGFTQHVLYGRDLVRVEWYRSTPEMMQGLMKNAFAAFDFSLIQLAAVTMLMLVLRVWPWIALFATHGAAWWLNLFTVFAGLALYIDFIRADGQSYRCLLFAPIVALLELAIWWRASISTLVRGGIVWRGTYYPLGELRRMRL